MIIDLEKLQIEDSEIETVIRIIPYKRCRVEFKGISSPPTAFYKILMCPEHNAKLKVGETDEDDYLEPVIGNKIEICDDFESK